MTWAEVLAFALPFPYVVSWLRASCDATACAHPDALCIDLKKGLVEGSASRHATYFCHAYLDQPLVALHVALLLAAALPLWVHSLAKRSTWLLDAHAPAFPLYVLLFHATHPRRAAGARGGVAAFLVLAWSARLAHNHWRREGWRPGAREDWGRAETRRALGPWFDVVSLSAVYLPALGLAAGCGLPLAHVFRPPGGAPRPLGPRDAAALTLALAGMGIAKAADDALAAFARTTKLETPGAVLDEGLWRLSRHPNRWGGHVYWLGVAGLAAAAAGSEARGALGVVPFLWCDAALFAPLLDRRMALRRDRVKAWVAYAARTPALWPSPASIRRWLAAAEKDA